jgi:hypothetical protein
MAEDNRKLMGAALAGGIAGAGGAAAIGASTSIRDRRRRRKQDASEKKAFERRQATKKTQTKVKKQTAEFRLERLQRIKPSDLDPRDRKIRTAYIKEQKNILKGLKPNPTASIAKTIGLRSLPGIGAFLTAISSTPVGDATRQKGFKQEAFKRKPTTKKKS